jgi:type IV secretion system protein VirD4
MKPLDIVKSYAPKTFGSAAFMERLEAVELKLDQRGDGAFLCPYVGGLAHSNEPGAKASMVYARAATTAVLDGAPKLREGSGHLMTVAPTRAGKGTGQIIPNLLRWTGSVVVVDVKGENYLLSAGCRREKLGQRIIRFAPFERKSAVWNPLLCIRATPGGETSTPEEEEDTRYLTNLLVTPTGSANDVFWENSAKNFLEGLLLHVRTAPLLPPDQTDSDEPEDLCRVRDRSMGEVRRLLTLGEDAFADLLEIMSHSSRTLVRQAGETMKRLSKGDGKTGNSILAVALEQTAVWGYSRLQRVTYRPGEGGEPAPNDFNFHELRDGKTSIYLIIPPDYLTEYRSVLRVLVGMAMRELRMSYKKADPDKPPVLFLLDEFPQLAYMRPIEEALLYLAGYNVRFWFFVQDVSQLQLHYPNSWRTFFANTGTQCFFGVSDIQTANLVSEMAGTATVYNHSFGGSTTVTDGVSGARTTGTATTTGRSSGPGGSGSSSSRSESESYTEGWNASVAVGRSTQTNFVGRRLITPDEVMRMHDYEQIIFLKGLKPIRATRIPWHSVRELALLGEIAPPEEIDYR